MFFILTTHRIQISIYLPCYNCRFMQYKLNFPFKFNNMPVITEPHASHPYAALLPNLPNDPLLGHLLFIRRRTARAVAYLNQIQIFLKSWRFKLLIMVSSFEDASNSATFYVKLLYKVLYKGHDMDREFYMMNIFDGTVKSSMSNFLQF